MNREPLHFGSSKTPIKHLITLAHWLHCEGPVTSGEPISVPFTHADENCRAEC